MIEVYKQVRGGAVGKARLRLAWLCAAGVPQICPLTPSSFRRLFSNKFPLIVSLGETHLSFSSSMDRILLRSSAVCSQAKRVKIPGRNRKISRPSSDVFCSKYSLKTTAQDKAFLFHPAAGPRGITLGGGLPPGITTQL